ncbi:MAG: hypothetical protein M1453_06945 [Acidobacteria bacterium]|nr:hypothetical protein [Acidobacteriota bacterium]MCL5287715.1 hypothetical protein [Acidobacteriota bacterium]
MRTLWRGISKTIFWSYERGTWPYDVLVGAIVLFVFLSPRAWFDDQPQLGPSGQHAQVQVLSEDSTGPTRTYRVNAQLLSIPKRTPELEKETHDVLRKNVDELRSRSFKIERIDPVRGEDGTILYYDIVVKK